MSDNGNIEKWLQFAKNDLLVARDLQLQKDFVYRAVLTHCQQSVEKYFKTFLLKNNIEIIRTHDLIILNKICLAKDSTFALFDEDLAWLSAVYRISLS